VAFSSRKLEDIDGGNKTVGDVIPFNLGETGEIDITVYFDNKIAATVKNVRKIYHI